jgi:hypothetical protein
MSAVQDLEAKLDMLRRLGLIDRLHHLGADDVTFFPVAAAASALPQAALQDLEQKRKEAAEKVDQARRFGAAGGMLPGRGKPPQSTEEEDRKREAQQIAQIREARKALDSK